MSDTPMTDAEVISTMREVEITDQFVEADFARTLEHCARAAYEKLQPLGVTFEQWVAQWEQK